MAANDMSNALKNPHPEVPFSHIGDDTIATLTKLAEIFKNKFQKGQTQGLPNESIKLFLAYSVRKPMVSHVHGFGPLLFDFFI
jgi:hypothetical protein